MTQFMNGLSAKKALLSFGTSAGLSFFVVASVLMFRLSKAGLPPKVIGLFALTGLPYNIRFLWPFLMEKIQLPYFVQLGQVKSWGIFSQSASLICFIILGFVDPIQHVYLAFSIALSLSFFSALHDIVSETYRFHFAKFLPHSSGVPLQTLGFRCGQFWASSLLPICGSVFGWAFAHSLMALFKVPAVFYLFKMPNVQDSFSKKVKSISEFFHILMPPYSFLLSIVLLRAIDTVLGPLQTIFLGKIGLDNFHFGVFKGGIGMAFVMLGIPFSGYLTKRIGIFRTLWVGVLCQSLAGLSSITLQYSEVSLPYLTCITAFQDFFQGFMNTSLLIYISSFCQKSMLIYQFTLLSTISSLSRAVSTIGLTWLVPFIGWTGVFSLPIFLCLPLISLFHHLTKFKLHHDVSVQ